MVFRPVVAHVLCSWAPVVAELSLAVSAAEPVKIHVDRFCGLGDNFVVDEAVSCGVVGLHGRAWLRVAKLA